MFEIGYMPEWAIFVPLVLLIIPITVSIYRRNEFGSFMNNTALFMISAMLLMPVTLIGALVGAFTFTTNDYTAVAPGPEFMQSKTLNEEKASAFIEESTQVSKVSVSKADAPEGSTTIDVTDEKTILDFTGVKDGKKISGSFYFKDNSMIITFADDSAITAPLDK